MLSGHKLHSSHSFIRISKHKSQKNYRFNTSFISAESNCHFLLPGEEMVFAEALSENASLDVVDEHLSQCYCDPETREEHIGMMGKCYGL